MGKIPTPVIYIMAGMLFIGAAPLPYGYYTLLRLLACGFFIWAAIINHQEQGKVLPWVFGFLAVLFNPIIKIYLPKEFWMVIDISAAIFILATKSKISESSNEHIKRDNAPPD